MLSSNDIQMHVRMVHALQMVSECIAHSDGQVKNWITPIGFLMDGSKVYLKGPFIVLFFRGNSLVTQVYLYVKTGEYRLVASDIYLMQSSSFDGLREPLVCNEPVKRNLPSWLVGGINSDFSA